MASIRDVLRELISELVGAARTRVELFGLEWQQARGQLAILVALLLAGVALLWLAVLMVSVLILTLTWNTPYRDWVVVGLLLLYLVGGIACLLALKSRLGRREDLPFAATVDELKRDAQMLSGSFESDRMGAARYRAQSSDGES
ncbi:phage holin family protein [Orrella sp. 11846]|uniref:phage holin family protein n=1 Tax=Orrella sp. 11846 TaxID=3409913 RepID=UPI003B593F92